MSLYRQASGQPKWRPAHSDLSKPALMPMTSVTWAYMVSEDDTS